MKAILSIGLVVAAVVAPFAIPALGIAAAGSLAAIAATAAVEVGISLISSAVMGPSMPKPITTSPSERISLS